MPVPLEGVLTQAQRQSLEIEDFIFHIIVPDAHEEEKVIYLDEVQLQPNQKTFFLDRLRETAEGTQYLFQPNAVHLKDKCISLMSAESDFLEISRQITADFSGRHRGQMSAGVFIVSVVKYLISANDWGRLIFLVKMDKQPSITYSYREESGRKIAVVEEVKNSLNETKNAIQKSALIDTSNQFAWDVLAFDKIKKPLLGEYFKAFLGVVERFQDSVLTKSAHDTVRRWAKKLSRAEIPEEEDANTYSGRSLNYLMDNDTFDTDGYLNAVVRDEDPERKRILIGSLRAALDASGISGQLFSPKPNSLKRKDKKQVYRTFEGVTIEYEGERSAAGISIEDRGNGKKRIIIETNRLDVGS
ncbi:hypothetical protein GCM10011613_21620 [Cellvibrio zantedeschiae]|uniref:Uncharacterized protein n=1 Tax=Cellvibrio zantedeschiae TaxID=1237077 RepID=A0ABQ3B3N5_9GAMM|nr:nucleoid-associated protein [Cellvibrio zantedeschiae]GGY76794.1 hypothetical protein GCM10011613_21620 [Cellvibrio zantedeschiae]